MTTSTAQTGYADVNGLHMYNEAHGRGGRLGVLRGGISTIDVDFGPSSSSMHRCRRTADRHAVNR